jgi:polyisoprenoid-binding protein YceI
MRYFLKLAAMLAILAPMFALATERYQIDPEHTYAVFEYNHWGLSLQRGRFDKSSGWIELNEDQHTGSLDISIDSASINTGSETFNKIMRSPNFFDTEQYPDIHFKSAQLVFAENGLSEINGELSIRGITLPVKLDITHFNCRFMILYMRQACGANGYTKILRSDFKIGRFVPFVSDEVTLYFSVEAIRD